MISIARIESTEDLVERAADALRALAANSGYLDGYLGRATDNAAVWVVVTRWADVGSYRRALGSYQVKLRATPLLAEADAQDSAFEELVHVNSDATVTRHGSDRS